MFRAIIALCMLFLIHCAHSATSLVLVKPDATLRGAAWSILDRLTVLTNSTVIGIKITRATAEMVDKHYQEHVEKAFFPELRSFMLGKDANIVAAVLCSKSKTLIPDLRAVVGATDPKKAEQGTIRASFKCESVTRNCIHASDSPASAEREITIWFGQDELIVCPKEPSDRDEL